MPLRGPPKEKLRDVLSVFFCLCFSMGVRAISNVYGCSGIILYISSFNPPARTSESVAAVDCAVSARVYEWPFNLLSNVQASGTGCSETDPVKCTAAVLSRNCSVPINLLYIGVCVFVCVEKVMLPVIGLLNNC